jgi:hypothetical protein
MHAQLHKHCQAHAVPMWLQQTDSNIYILMCAGQLLVKQLQTCSDSCVQLQQMWQLPKLLIAMSPAFS